MRPRMMAQTPTRTRIRLWSHRTWSPRQCDTQLSSKNPAESCLQSFLRKLKFRYLEQNAKSKYITAIVSDIDDAAIVTAEDNKALSLVCEEKKEKLRVAKAGLAEVRTNIRTLAPKVEAGTLSVFATNAYQIHSTQTM